MTYPKHQDVAPGTLQPNPWNSNRVSPDNEAKLDASLRRRGMFKPVLVRELADGSLQIIGGQHRAESAQRLKLKTVPVFNLGPISEVEAKEIGVLDNGRYGNDDALQLAQILESLGTPEDLAKFMPYSDQDFESIFASTNIALDNLDLPDDDDLAPSTPPSKAVQTHQVMRFRIPMGDVEAVTEAIERTMRQQGFTEEDSLANAGNALVHLVRKAQGS